MNKFLAFTTVCWVSGVAGAAVPSEWKYSQLVPVSTSGLTKVRLTEETLGKAQPNLSDLRLLDAQGREVPFLIDQPRSQPPQMLPLERMVMTMEKKKTIIQGTVPVVMRTYGFEAITLFTPTDDFLKPLTLEGSNDGQHWTTLIRQAPIFKQSGDGTSSTIRLAKGAWSMIRITLDDSDSPPVRVSGIALYGKGQAVKDLVELEPEVLEVASDARKTEINLLLPAAGLPVDAIRFDVPDTTFRRQVRLSVREFSSGEFHEQTLATGSIYRITMGAQTSEELAVPVRQAIPGSLVTLTIENGDSPALTMNHIRVRIIPRDLIFDAPSTGAYQLCSGNDRASARNYDLVSLQGSLSKADLRTVVPAPLQLNPSFQSPAPPVLGEEEGSDINTDPWHFRKTVLLSTPSPLVGEGWDGGTILWRIELDPEAIAHNGGRLEALRLVRNDHQLPYIVDYAGVERMLALTLQAETASVKGKSQWSLKLPYAGLPISQLRFTIPNTLFQRTVMLYEVTGEPNPETGESKRFLGSATWRRVRADGPSLFDLSLSHVPRTAHLILETDNGDNAPIHPMAVQAYYRAPRLVFRSASNKDPLVLLYGQPEVAAPQYDLNLIASELLSTPPQEAKLGPEEALKATPWWEAPAATGKLKPIFWGVMIFVVLGLLAVIAKLLPQPNSQDLS